MDKLGKFLLFLMVMSIRSLVEALVLCRLWNWFAVPAGLMQISVPIAWGLTCIVALVTMPLTSSVMEGREWDYWVALRRSLVMSCAALLVLGEGWVVHLFLR